MNDSSNHASGRSFLMPFSRPPREIPPFSELRQEDAPRRLSIDPKKEGITTVIAPGAQIIGDQIYEQGLKINGCIRGNVEFGTTDGLCILDKGAIIEGDLIGPRALIFGEVKGNLHITDLVVLAPTARVDGTVTYGRMITYDGAEINGTMRKITTNRLLKYRPANADGGMERSRFS